jgi:hypothetical protein
MVAEGNCFVVYMYENVVVQSSLNLRSEQVLFYQPLPGKSSVLYQLLQQDEGIIHIKIRNKFANYFPSLKATTGRFANFIL